MALGHIDFPTFLAGEEQNLLITWSNLHPDFQVFTRLDSLLREPVALIDVPSGQEVVPGLYLFTHYHLYVSVANLARSHLSESLASTRKAIDASLAAYEIILDPSTAPLYEARDKRFLFIKAHIDKARKADESRYPLAVELIQFHDVCSEIGSHADISSFIYRVEQREMDDPSKNQLFFHYFQFSTDTDEYHLHFVETLLAFFHIARIFEPMIKDRAKGLRADWSADLAKVGAALAKEHASVAAHLAARTNAYQRPNP